MRLRSVAALLWPVSCVATPVPPPAGHHWIPPGPGDVRSPCPGLNSLANHGFLPRSGKAITVLDFVNGGREGLNMGFDFMFSVGLLGMLAAGPNITTVDLDQLQEHDFPIEHDGSLSRQDFYFGQDDHLHLPEYRQFWSFYDNLNSTSIATAAAARWARVNNSLTTNPTVDYGPRQLILSYGETALYLQTMGRSTTSGVAPVSYVHSLFRHERLPYHLGWTPPPETIDLQSIGQMTLQLQAATPDLADEAIYVLTKGTYRDLLYGILRLNDTRSDAS